MWKRLRDRFTATRAESAAVVEAVASAELAAAIPGSIADAAPVALFAEHKRKSAASFIGFVEGGEDPRWPQEVFLEISNICDLQCAMCPTFSALNPERFRSLRATDRGLLDYEKSKEPLETVLQHALVVHAFGYGEPTIHPQFREFIEYLAQFEVMVDFFSHGMHLDEDLCEFLVLNRVQTISISFSGATAEEYENVYIGGDFDRVLKGLHTLTEAKRRHGSPYPLIEVNSLGFNHHVEKLPQFVRLMGEHGVNTIHLKPLQTYDVIQELHTHTSIMRPDIEGEIVEEAKKVAAEFNLNLASKPYEATAQMWDKHPENPVQARHKGGKAVSEQATDISELKIIARSAEKKAAKLEFKKPTEAEEERTRRLREKPRQFITNKGVPCLEPFKTMYARYNGDVYPCCFKADTGHALGKLGEASAETIWNAPAWSEMREYAREGKYPADICGPCLRAQTYPKSHNYLMKLNHYSKWFRQGFDTEFAPALVQRAHKLPGNIEVFASVAEQQTGEQ